MGLDMYAYVVDENEVKNDFEFKGEPTRLHYWRKHHDLHGWMTRLWMRKATEFVATFTGLFAPPISADSISPDNFNCVPVRLTLEDLEDLRVAVVEGKLPETQGFFFGNNEPDEESKAEDLAFIDSAIGAIKDGKAVYYDSWW